MKTNMIVIDEFYNNPNDVREFALSQEFDVTGNWPGSRTKTFINESTKETIQKILQDVSGNVTDWQANDGYTGSFQLTTSMDRSWIHADSYNTWAGVLYLTPDAPLSGGTGIFRYKKTGSMAEDGTDLSGVTQDMTKWELVDRVGNVYNRLVLYRGNNYHMSLDYFGKDKEDGRLFQLFFITTEY
jgi:hypothetical protein